MFLPNKIGNETEGYSSLEEAVKDFEETSFSRSLLCGLG